MKDRLNSDFLNQIRTTTSIHCHVSEGDRVLLAVSGGLDSTVLADVFFQLQTLLRIKCRLCHVNHGLRGEEAYADERFVVSLADRYDFPLTIRRFEDDEVKQIRNGNLEENARELRYRKLVQTAEELDCNQIATAHTASDQAETVLHRLMRGAGISGLAAIQPIRVDLGIPIIRPMLFHTHKEVYQYAKETALRFRIDSMNEDLRFTRVRIRKQLIPLLRNEFNPQIENALTELANQAEEEERFWKNHIHSQIQKIGNATPPSPTNRLAFLALSLAEQRRILRVYFHEVGITTYRIHIHDCLSLLTGNNPQAEIHLPGGKRLIRRYDIFFITAHETKIECTREHTLHIPGTTILREFGVEMRAELQPIGVISLTGQKEYTAKFDADKIQKPIIVRSRMDGDTIQPLGMAGRKKVKKILQEKKIPRERRDRIPLICFGNEIAWIVGGCSSEKFRVTDVTHMVLHLAALPLPTATNV
ncbi:MAG: tRNA lysidine(34) synthetase TilS [Candidatus Omnitrophota bacterium]|jgi:tRNA(Ile)-lysidine synthase|nr:MAG: tRNA lysidine(34) synthetase TilS [Candidatus Omnitrophota bacterium]